VFPHLTADPCAHSNRRRHRILGAPASSFQGSLPLMHGAGDFNSIASKKNFCPIRRTENGRYLYLKSG